MSNVKANEEMKILRQTLLGVNASGCLHKVPWHFLKWSFNGKLLNLEQCW